MSNNRVTVWNNNEGLKTKEAIYVDEKEEEQKVEEQIVKETPKEEITMIKLNELRSNPYQPRKVFDQTALQELAESIRIHGVFQPIIVKKSIKGYEIIAICKI